MAAPIELMADKLTRLHRYIVRNHWDGRSIAGPDAGIRFNARVGRFIKSYLGVLPWSDNYRYIQAQAYWVFSNWLLADLQSSEEAEEFALSCSTHILESQKPEGYWDYPNPEWKGRIATVEGVFGGLAMLESYARTGNESFLDGARRWHDFMVNGTGFQGSGEFLAVNYFANVPRGMVPNNSTLAAWFLARLSELTGDERYMERARGMIRWLSHVQLESGELPYAVGSNGAKDRPHFLCYQYNAFELMDLMHYYRITGDESLREMLVRLAAYVAEGVTDSGAARYDCHHRLPEVSYYTAALAAALSQATRMGLGDYSAPSQRAYDRILSQFRPHGGLDFFSRGNYRALSDRRSYPRYLAMVLYHLLLEVQSRGSSMSSAETEARVRSVYQKRASP